MKYFDRPGDARNIARVNHADIVFQKLDPESEVSQ